LTYNIYAFTSEKPLSLVERNFCLAISRVLSNASILIDKKLFTGSVALETNPDFFMGCRMIVSGGFEFICNLNGYYAELSNENCCCVEGDMF
jgi:hypothetical protein